MFLFISISTRKSKCRYIYTSCLSSIFISKLYFTSIKNVFCCLIEDLSGGVGTPMLQRNRYIFSFPVFSDNKVHFATLRHEEAVWVDPKLYRGEPAGSSLSPSIDFDIESEALSATSGSTEDVVPTVIRQPSDDSMMSSHHQINITLVPDQSLSESKEARGASPLHWSHSRTLRSNTTQYYSQNASSANVYYSASEMLSKNRRDEEWQDEMNSIRLQQVS